MRHVDGRWVEVHRQSLPIAAPCQVFRPQTGRTFCGQCQTHVHDLSALTPAQAEALLAANAGRTLCVAYRTDATGTLVHRAKPRRFALAAAVLGSALALAACAGHGGEARHPAELCRDPLGYERDCENPRYVAGPSIPDADARIDGEATGPADGELVLDDTALDDTASDDDAELSDEPAAESDAATEGIAGVQPVPWEDDGGTVGIVLHAPISARNDTASSDAADQSSERKTRRASRREARRLARQQR